MMCGPHPPSTTRLPHPPDGFADIADITKLTGLFGKRCTPLLEAIHFRCLPGVGSQFGPGPDESPISRALIHTLRESQSALAPRLLGPTLG